MGTLRDYVLSKREDPTLSLHSRSLLLSACLTKSLLSKSLTIWHVSFFRIGFDAFILVVILINTFIISFQKPGENNSAAVKELESFCTFVFIWELLLKLAGLGISEYFADPWNRLDFIVVMESIVGFILVRPARPPARPPA